LTIAEAATGQTLGVDDKWQLDRFTRTLRHNVRMRLEQPFQRLRQETKFAYILLCEASVYRCAVPEDWWLSHLDYWDWDSESALKALDALHETDHLYGLCHRQNQQRPFMPKHGQTLCMQGFQGLTIAHF